MLLKMCKFVSANYNKMRTVHITEKKLNRDRGPGFYIVMGIMWLWPLVVLQASFPWYLPNSFMPLLRKSTWVLYAGVTQTLILVFLKPLPFGKVDWLLIIMVLLGIASFFLIPFGFGEDLEYMEGILFSIFLHTIPLAAAVCAVFPDVGGASLSSNRASSTSYRSCSHRDYSHDRYSTQHYRHEDSLGSHVWGGGEISDDFYGHRGKFDLNDEARRVSEDMQQFHHSHPDADLSDHYYWEDVLDAETDGYLDD